MAMSIITTHAPIWSSKYNGDVEAFNQQNQNGAPNTSIDMSTMISWIDHFIKDAPSKKRQFGAISKSNAHVASFVKRTMKFLQCTRRSELPPLNYSNLKKYFLLYSHPEHNENKNTNEKNNSVNRVWVKDVKIYLYGLKKTCLGVFRIEGDT